MVPRWCRRRGHGGGRRKVVINPTNPADNEFRDNAVTTAKYTWYTFLPVGLWEQVRRVANAYFLIISVLQLATDLSPTSPYSTIIPLSIVLAVSLVKEASEDVKRHRADAAVNAAETRVLCTASPARWLHVQWRTLRAGNIVLLQRDAPVPADMVLLSVAPHHSPLTARMGCGEPAYVDTSSLDGETNLKARVPLAETSQVGSHPDAWGGVSGCLVCEGPNPKIHHFEGRLRVRLQAPQPPPSPIAPPVAAAAGSGGGGTCTPCPTPSSGASPASVTRVPDTPPPFSALSASPPNVGPSHLPGAPATLPLHTLSNECGGPAHGVPAPPGGLTTATPSTFVIPVTVDNIILRGMTLKNTEWVVGMVVYAGHDTKQMCNARRAPSKRSRLDTRIDLVVAALFALLLLLCAITATGAMWLEAATPFQRSWYLPFAVATGDTPASLVTQFIRLFVTSLLLYNGLVPISLYVTLEVVRFVQARAIDTDCRMVYTLPPPVMEGGDHSHHTARLHARDSMSMASPTPEAGARAATSGDGAPGGGGPPNQPAVGTPPATHPPPTTIVARARTSNLNESLGQISYLFSDKTGTLTCNMMHVRVMTVGGRTFRLGLRPINADAGTPPVGFHPPVAASAPAIIRLHTPSAPPSGRPASPSSDPSNHGSLAPTTRSVPPPLPVTEWPAPGGLHHPHNGGGGGEATASLWGPPTLAGEPPSPSHATHAVLKGEGDLVAQARREKAKRENQARAPPLLAAALTHRRPSSEEGSAGPTGRRSRSPPAMSSRPTGRPRCRSAGSPESVDASHASPVTVRGGASPPHPSTYLPRLRVMSSAARSTSLPPPPPPSVADLEGLPAETSAAMARLRGLVDQRLLKSLTDAGDPAHLQLWEFIVCIAVCHTVMPTPATNTCGTGVEYQSSSPDETALVEAAKALGVELMQRDGQALTLRVLGLPVRMRVLAVNEFTSARRRMSVLIRHADGRVVLYAKGADSVILPLVSDAAPNVAPPTPPPPVMPSPHLTTPPLSPSPAVPRAPPFNRLQAVPESVEASVDTPCATGDHTPTSLGAGDGATSPGGDTLTMIALQPARPRAVHVGRHGAPVGAPSSPSAEGEEVDNDAPMDGLVLAASASSNQPPGTTIAPGHRASSLSPPSNPSATMPLQHGSGGSDSSHTSANPILPPMLSFPHSALRLVSGSGQDVLPSPMVMSPSRIPVAPLPSINESHESGMSLRIGMPLATGEEGAYPANSPSMHSVATAVADGMSPMWSPHVGGIIPGGGVRVDATTGITTRINVVKAGLLGAASSHARALQRSLEVHASTSVAPVPSPGHGTPGSSSHSGMDAALTPGACADGSSGSSHPAFDHVVVTTHTSAAPMEEGGGAHKGALHVDGEPTGRSDGMGGERVDGTSPGSSRLYGLIPTVRYTGRENMVMDAEMEARDLLTPDKLRALATLQDHLDAFASDGLRTLVMARRPVDEASARHLMAMHHEASLQVRGRDAALHRVADEMEQDLELLGACGIEDKLQERVPATISALSHAGLKVWMLTGDKTETAVSIGFSSRLLTEGMDIVTLRSHTWQACANDLASAKELLMARGTWRPDKTNNNLALIIEGTALHEMLPLHTGGAAVASRRVGGAASARWSRAGEEAATEEEEEGEEEGDVPSAHANHARRQEGTWAWRRVDGLWCGRAWWAWWQWVWRGLPPGKPAPASVAYVAPTVPPDAPHKDPVHQLPLGGVGWANPLAAQATSTATVATTSNNTPTLTAAAPPPATFASGHHHEPGGMPPPTVLFKPSQPHPGGHGHPHPAVFSPQQQHQMEDDFLEFVQQCKAVIACRMSPLQKAQLVRLIRRRGLGSPLCAAIGDGANDVSMIQEADVGIGIQGREGCQAANSADFSIGRFWFLTQLLLVHGRLNYRRITLVTLYSLYKNAVAVGFLFLFTFSNRFSGTTLFESYVGSAFNVLFTSLPILIVGMYDVDMPARWSRAYPPLYRVGPNNERFCARRIAAWVALAGLHAGLLYTMSHFCLLEPVLDGRQGHEDGLTLKGTIAHLLLVVTVTVTLMAEVHTWHSHFGWAFLASVVSWFAFVLIYSSLHLATPAGFAADIAAVGWHVVARPMTWVLLPPLIVAVALPSVVAHWARRFLAPTVTSVVEEWARGYGVPLPLAALMGKMNGAAQPHPSAASSHGMGVGLPPSSAPAPSALANLHAPALYRALSLRGHTRNRTSRLSLSHVMGASGVGGQVVPHPTALSTGSLHLYADSLRIPTAAGSFHTLMAPHHMVQRPVPPPLRHVGGVEPVEHGRHIDQLTRLMMEEVEVLRRRDRKMMAMLDKVQGGVAGAAHTPPSPLAGVASPTASLLGRVSTLFTWGAGDGSMARGADPSNPPGRLLLTASINRYSFGKGYLEGGGGGEGDGPPAGVGAPPMHPITLRFYRDPALESHFMQTFVRKSVRLSRLVLFIAVLFGTVYACFELDNVPMATSIVRFALVAAGTLFVAFTCIPAFRRHFIPSMTLALVVTGMAKTVVIDSGGEFGQAVFQLGIMLALRLPFAHAFAICMGDLVFFLVYTLARGLHTPATVPVFLIYIAFVTGYATSGAYFLHTAMRQDFVQQNQLYMEEGRGADLLNNLLPGHVVSVLRESRGRYTGIISFYEPSISILFIDVCQFHQIVATRTPAMLIELLDRFFSLLDALADKHGVVKYETVGKSYVAVSGLQGDRPDHAAALTLYALDIARKLALLVSREGTPVLTVRMGINSGPVVSGIVGRKRPQFCLVGDTINTASRMMSHSEPGKINVSPATHALLGDAFATKAHEVEVKSKGLMTCHYVYGVRKGKGAQAGHGKGGRRTTRGRGDTAGLALRASPPHTPPSSPAAATTGAGSLAFRPPPLLLPNADERHTMTATPDLTDDAPTATPPARLTPAVSGGEEGASSCSPSGAGTGYGLGEGAARHALAAATLDGGAGGVSDLEQGARTAMVVKAMERQAAEAKRIQQRITRRSRDVAVRACTYTFRRPELERQWQRARLRATVNPFRIAALLLLLFHLFRLGEVFVRAETGSAGRGMSLPGRPSPREVIVRLTAAGGLALFIILTYLPWCAWHRSRGRRRRPMPLRGTSSRWLVARSSAAVDEEDGEGGMGGRTPLSRGAAVGDDDDDDVGSEGESEGEAGSTSVGSPHHVDDVVLVRCHSVRLRRGAVRQATLEAALFGAGVALIVAGSNAEKVTLDLLFLFALVSNGTAVPFLRGIVINAVVAVVFVAVTQLTLWYNVALTVYSGLFLLAAWVMTGLAAASTEYYLRHRFGVHQLTADEVERNNALLHRMLPVPIAQELLATHGSRYISQGFEGVTILFCDIQGFTKLSAAVTPQQVITMMNRLFTAFDALTEVHDTFKLMTIGDCYVCVAGIPYEDVGVDRYAKGGPSATREARRRRESHRSRRQPPSRHPVDVLDEENAQEATYAQCALETIRGQYWSLLHNVADHTGCPIPSIPGLAPGLPLTTASPSHPLAHVVPHPYLPFGAQGANDLAWAIATSIPTQASVPTQAGGVWDAHVHTPAHVARGTVGPARSMSHGRVHRHREHGGDAGVMMGAERDVTEVGEYGAGYDSAVGLGSRVVTAASAELDSDGSGAVTSESGRQTGQEGRQDWLGPPALPGAVVGHGDDPHSSVNAVAHPSPHPSPGGLRAKRASGPGTSASSSHSHSPGATMLHTAATLPNAPAPPLLLVPTVAGGSADAGDARRFHHATPPPQPLTTPHPSSPLVPHQSWAPGHRGASVKNPAAVPRTSTWVGLGGTEHKGVRSIDGHGVTTTTTTTTVAATTLTTTAVTLASDREFISILRVPSFAAAMKGSLSMANMLSSRVARLASHGGSSGGGGVGHDNGGRASVILSKPHLDTSPLRQPRSHTTRELGVGASGVVRVGSSLPATAALTHRLNPWGSVFSSAQTVDVDDDGDSMGAALGVDDSAHENGVEGGRHTLHARPAQVAPLWTSTASGSPVPDLVSVPLVTEPRAKSPAASTDSRRGLPVAVSSEAAAFSPNPTAMLDALSPSNAAPEVMPPYMSHVTQTAAVALASAAHTLHLPPLTLLGQVGTARVGSTDTGRVSGPLEAVGPPAPHPEWNEGGSTSPPPSTTAGVDTTTSVLGVPVPCVPKELVAIADYVKPAPFPAVAWAVLGAEAAEVVEPVQLHAARQLRMAVDMVDCVRRVRNPITGQPIKMRFGLHTGNIVGGVIGTKTYRYDAFGPDVLAANEMEANGIGGGILVSRTTRDALASLEGTPYAIPGLSFLPHKTVVVKGLGSLDTFVVQLEGFPLPAHEEEEGEGGTSTHPPAPGGDAGGKHGAPLASGSAAVPAPV